MGDLTLDLSVREFACKCKYPDCKAHKSVAHMPLVLLIQDAADHFKKKYYASDVRITITCGNRCKKHDVDVQMKDAGKTRAEAEAMDSQHVYCTAADHRMQVMTGLNWQTVPNDDLYDYYDKKYFDRLGVGFYGDRVHVDTRQTKARWGMTK